MDEYLSNFVESWMYFNYIVRKTELNIKEIHEYC